MSRRYFHFDKERGEMVPGIAPDRTKRYGRAPFVITDTTTPYYHPAVCKWTDSKRKIDEFDKVTGTITTDKKLAPDPSRQRRLNQEREADIEHSMRKAVAQLDAGTAPLTEEIRALCEAENDRISKALNFDAFNVAGRKTNERGKRYRRS